MIFYLSRPHGYPYGWLYISIPYRRFLLNTVYIFFKVSPHRHARGDPINLIAYGRRSLPSAYAGLPARRRSAVSVRSPHQWCGLLRQFGSGLRAGFAVLLRQHRRVMVFFPGTCPGKNISIAPVGAGCARRNNLRLPITRLLPRAASAAS